MAFSLSCFVALCFLHLSRSEDCVFDIEDRTNIWEMKLYEHLKECDLLNTPSSNTSKVEVDVYFIPSKFAFDPEEELLTIYTDALIRYKDDRLIWNENDFGELSSLVIPDYMIWTPNLEAFSFLDSGVVNSKSFCNIFNDGQVQWPLSVEQTTYCDSDLKYWPYDIQKCTFYIKNSTKVDYDIEFFFIALRRRGASFGVGWSMKDYKENENLKKDVKMSMAFVLQRKAEDLITMVIVPSFTVSVLTITVLFLEVMSEIRLFIGCFTLLLHLYLLSEINDYIPKYNAGTPYVLIFVSVSNILTSITVALSLLFRYLIRRKMSFPSKMGLLNEFVCARRVLIKYVIWPNLNDTFLEDSDSNIVAWTKLTCILNSIFLYLFVFIYFVMFLICMPRKSFEISI